VPPPEVCRARKGDWHALHLYEPAGCDGFYADDQIDKLRALPDEPAFDQIIDDPAKLPPGVQFHYVTVKRVADKARAAEIIAAFDAWKAADDALAAECAYDRDDEAFDERVDRFNDERNAVVDAIMAATPGTLDGLAVQARVAQTESAENYDDTAEPAAKWCKVLARSIAALTEKAAMG